MALHSPCSVKLWSVTREHRIFFNTECPSIAERCAKRCWPGVGFTTRSGTHKIVNIPSAEVPPVPFTKGTPSVTKLNQGSFRERNLERLSPTSVQARTRLTWYCSTNRVAAIRRAAGFRRFFPAGP